MIYPSNGVPKTVFPVLMYSYIGIQFGVPKGREVT